MTTGMEMSEQPRSRRQTRAAILGHLLQSGGMFRPPLAKAVRLSEASLSRILFDLKAEGLIVAGLRRSEGGDCRLHQLPGSAGRTRPHSRQPSRPAW
jgi:predicted ArsR family transcriptional regulator